MKMIILSTGIGWSLSSKKRALAFIESLTDVRGARGCFLVDIGSTAVSHIAIKYGSMSGIWAYNSIWIANFAPGETTGTKEGA